MRQLSRSWPYVKLERVSPGEQCVLKDPAASVCRQLWAGTHERQEVSQTQGGEDCGGLMALSWWGCQYCTEDHRFHSNYNAKPMRLLTQRFVHDGKRLLLREWTRRSRSGSKETT